MGCQISKEEEDDEKRHEQQRDSDIVATKTMASKSTSDYKSRLEWKLCLVCTFTGFFF